MCNAYDAYEEWCICGHPRCEHNEELGTCQGTQDCDCGEYEPVEDEDENVA